MKITPFYEGENARTVLDYLLADIPNPDDPKRSLSRYQLRDGDYAVNKYGFCCGHFQEGDHWIAFDNSTGQCWEEEFSSEKECLSYLKQDLGYYYLDYLYREIWLLPEDVEFVPEMGRADFACSVIADKKYVQKQLENIPDDKLFEAVKALCDNPELTSRRDAYQYIVWMVALGIKEDI